jgi:hypothetical protein
MTLHWVVMDVRVTRNVKWDEKEVLVGKETHEVARAWKAQAHFAGEEGALRV